MAYLEKAKKDTLKGNVTIILCFYVSVKLKNMSVTGMETKPAKVPLGRENGQREKLNSTLGWQQTVCLSLQSPGGSDGHPDIVRHKISAGRFRIHTLFVYLTNRQRGLLQQNLKRFFILKLSPPLRRSKSAS